MRIYEISADRWYSGKARWCFKSNANVWNYAWPMKVKRKGKQYVRVMVSSGRLVAWLKRFLTRPWQFGKVK